MGHAPTPDEKWQPSCRFSILIRSSRPKKLRRKTTSLKPLRPHELSDTDSLSLWRLFFIREGRDRSHRSWRNVVDHQIQAWYRSKVTWYLIWASFFRSFWQPIFRNWSGASAVLDPAERARSGHIGSPSHFRGVWASPAPRREAPRGRTTPRLPWNDWGKVLLECTCVTSHATYKKKAGRDGILTRSVSLIFAILTLSLKRPGSIWAAGGLISQSAFVNP